MHVNVFPLVMVRVIKRHTISILNFCCATAVLSGISQVFMKFVDQYI